MLCTLSKLFWSSKLARTSCGGCVRNIGDLTENTSDLLKRQNCRDIHTNQSFSLAQLLINRLTPHNIDTEALSGIGVCRNHLVSIVFSSFVGTSYNKKDKSWNYLKINNNPSNKYCLGHGYLIHSSLSLLTSGGGGG